MITRNFSISFTHSIHFLNWTWLIWQITWKIKHSWTCFYGKIISLSKVWGRRVSITNPKLIMFREHHILMCFILLYFFFFLSFSLSLSFFLPPGIVFKTRPSSSDMNTSWLLYRILQRQRPTRWNQTRGGSWCKLKNDLKEETKHEKSSQCCPWSPSMEAGCLKSGGTQSDVLTPRSPSFSCWLATERTQTHRCYRNINSPWKELREREVKKRLKAMVLWCRKEVTKVLQVVAKVLLWC